MLTVKAEREKTLGRLSLKDYIGSKQLLPDYATYLRWRRIIPDSRPSYPLGEIAVAALHREQAQNYRLHGGKCKACGTLQYPPQRICVKCQAKDQVELVRLSDKKVTLVTYSLDYGSWSPQMPSVASVINFDDGGRMECFTVDWRSESDIVDGMPLEMTFRKLYLRDGIQQYLWKSMPLRA